jgi:uncharacterized RDD family membrane protein YckC
MNCPVCDRQLAPTLSICLTCGTMMNDSVREEVLSNGNLRATQSVKSNLNIMPEKEPAVAAVASVALPKPLRIEFAAEPPARTRTETMEFESKKTSQTLKDFQNRNAALPDWRIQLQNSVRQRKTSDVDARAEGITELRKTTATNGANALKAEFVEESIEVKHEDPRVANALKRIEKSRRTYMRSEKPKPAVRPSVRPNYPFNVISRTTPTPQPVAEPKPVVEMPKASPQPEAKAKRVSSLRIEKKGFDTNKLPKLPIDEPEFKAVPETPLLPDPPKLIESVSIAEARFHIDSEPALDEAAMRELDDLHFEMVAEAAGETEKEDVDDLATFSMRFGAGVFDVIIAGFGSLILLSPLAFTAERFFSLGNTIIFLVLFCVSMFLYSTASLARFGRTIGMKLFGIELIDVAENVYPTFRQSMLSSAAYLASLLLGGLGFVPMLLNREKRALHDLVSQTIVVREL